MLRVGKAWVEYRKGGAEPFGAVEGLGVFCYGLRALEVAWNLVLCSRFMDSGSI